MTITLTYQRGDKVVDEVERDVSDPQVTPAGFLVIRDLNGRIRRMVAVGTVVNMTFDDNTIQGVKLT